MLLHFSRDARSKVLAEMGREKKITLEILQRVSASCAPLLSLAVRK